MPKSSSWCASSCALLYRPERRRRRQQPAVGAGDEQIVALAVEEGAQCVDEVAEDAAGVDGRLTEEADRDLAAEQRERRHAGELAERAAQGGAADGEADAHALGRDGFEAFGLRGDPSLEGALLPREALRRRLLQHEGELAAAAPAAASAARATRRSSLAGSPRRARTPWACSAA